MTKLQEYQPTLSPLDTVKNKYRRRCTVIGYMEMAVHSFLFFVLGMIAFKMIHLRVKGLDKSLQCLEKQIGMPQEHIFASSVILLIVEGFLVVAAIHLETAMLPEIPARVTLTKVTSWKEAKFIGWALRLVVFILTIPPSGHPHPNQIGIFFLILWIDVVFLVVVLPCLQELKEIVGKRVRRSVVASAEIV